MERFAGDNPQLSNLDLALSNSPKDPQDRFDPYAQNASTVNMVTFRELLYLLRILINLSLLLEYKQRLITGLSR